MLGQADFGTARDDATASLLKQPAALASDGRRLFVADAGRQPRARLGAALPTANGAAADVVVGQGDFKHAAANDDAQAGTDGAAPTARTLSFPSGVAAAGGARSSSATPSIAACSCSARTSGCAV